MAHDPTRISPDDDVNRWIGWTFIVGAIVFLGYGGYRFVIPATTAFPPLMLVAGALALGAQGIWMVRKP